MGYLEHLDPRIHRVAPLAAILRAPCARGSSHAACRTHVERATLVAREHVLLADRRVPPTGRVAAQPVGERARGRKGPARAASLLILNRLRVAHVALGGHKRALVVRVGQRLQLEEGRNGRSRELILEVLREALETGLDQRLLLRLVALAPLLAPRIGIGVGNFVPLLRATQVVAIWAREHSGFQRDGATRQDRLALALSRRIRLKPTAQLRRAHGRAAYVKVAKALRCTRGESLLGHCVVVLAPFDRVVVAR